MLSSKIAMTPELNEANFHAGLCHSIQLLKNIYPMMLVSFLFADEKTFISDHRTRRMINCTHIHQRRRKTSWQLNKRLRTQLTLSRRVTMIDITPVSKPVDVVSDDY